MSLCLKSNLPLRVVLSRVGEASLTEYSASKFLLDSPEKGTEFWQNVIASDPFFEADKEHLISVMLTTKYRVLGYHVVSIGSLSETIAHPREIFRAAIIASASAMMILHNHPSGDPEPSKSDHQMTRRIIEVAEIIGIRLLDHVVVGDSIDGRKPYSSFREMGVIF